MCRRCVELACAAILAACVASAARAATAPAAPAPAGARERSHSTSAAEAGRVPATPLFGVTIDRIANLRAITSSLKALPRRATTRVYFDVHEPASYYAHAVAEVHAVSGVMGELLDSSDEKAISASALRKRAQSYLQALAPDVDVWEVGNELNGNWTGPYAIVAEKLAAAYEAVSAAGGTTALTLYANDFAPEHCGDGESELTPLQFSERYVPPQIADGLRYVLLSYYPTQCAGVEPTAAELAGELEALHALYPNARLGFGEVGLPHPASSRTLATAEQIMRWAYSLAPGLPYYVGGYFWWYGAQDALHSGARLAAALGEAFEDEAAALGA